MARLQVNDELQTMEHPYETWGDLLAWADSISAERGLMVTAVRLNGVDEPSFRQPELSARRLGASDLMEIVATTPAKLVADSLEAARAGLTGLRTHALEVARRFRDSRVAHANARLAELVHGLGTLVTLVEAVSGAMGIAIESLTLDGRPAVGLIEDLAQPLAELTEAQTQQDWVTLADILEFDLEPAVARVAPLFAALGALAQQAGAVSIR